MIEKFFKKNQKEIEDDFLETEFTLGRSISKGIPWNDFSEKEIQGILKIHFERLGFKVIWRHGDDPANEKGIDLECNHKSNHKKIIIAVKKKPKIIDLGQVLQLSQHDADQRIYLYLNGATQSFRDQFGTYESKIEFWDEKKLEQILEESGLAVWLKIDNSYAVNAINSINKIIFSSIINPSGKSFPKPNKAILNTLWDLKDRAVTLSKCSTMAQLMFEDSTRLSKIEYSQIQNLQIWCLDFLYTHSLFSMASGFESLSNDLKTILAYTYEKTRVRSNWFMLNSIRPGFIPGNIESILQHKIQENLSDNESSNEENYEQHLDKSDLEKKYLHQAASEFRCIGVWADGLEYTIDDLFQECLSKRF